MTYTDEDWRKALQGFVEDIEGSPEEVINKFMQKVRQIDWRWREEIAKHLPQIDIMSFCGPVSTIRWLMDHVQIKPEHQILADDLNAIKNSLADEDEKTHLRLTTLFPKLACAAGEECRQEMKDGVRQGEAHPKTETEQEI